MITRVHSTGCTHELREVSCPKVLVYVSPVPWKTENFSTELLSLNREKQQLRQRLHLTAEERRLFPTTHGWSTAEMG